MSGASNNSFPYANELRLLGKFPDIVLKVGERSFPCHRMILASASKYFQHMFAKNFNEAHKKEIELKALNADDFELLLTHIYGGSVSLNDNNAYRLLRISHYMNLKNLEDCCTEFLVSSDSVPLNTAIYIFIFASRVGATVLMDEFTARIARNFVAVSTNEKFFHISSDALSRILSHSDLNADATTILDYLTGWMKHQSTEDRKSLINLLSNVNFKNMPVEWLVKTITSLTAPSDTSDGGEEEKVDPSLFSEQIYMESFFDFEMPGIVDDDRNDKKKLPFVLYTQDIRNVTKEYHINRSRLEGRNNLIALSTHNDVMINRYDSVTCKSFIVDGIPTLMLLDYNDLVKDESSDCSTHSEDRDCHWDDDNFSGKVTFRPYFYYQNKSHALKTKIHASGYNDTTMTSGGAEIYLYSCYDFHRYSWQDNEWSQPISKVGFKRTKYSDLLFHEGCLYMIGGKEISGKNNGKFFQRYDLREGKWSQLPEMKHSRCRAASCVHDDILYVSGGSYLTYFKGCIECYDFKAGKWDIFETSMPRPKMNHSMFAYDNQLWFFGGIQYKPDGKGFIPDLSWYSYDLKEHKWSSIFFVPEFRGRFQTRSIFDVVVEI